MKSAKAGLSLLLVVAGPLCLGQPDFARDARAVTPASADPAIVRALTVIDPSRIEETIKTLVGFNTRNSLSSMEQGLPAGTGVEAAADWIAAGVLLQLV